MHRIEFTLILSVLHQLWFDIRHYLGPSLRSKNGSLTISLSLSFYMNQQPIIRPPTTTIQTTKFSPARFLNPWNDLSRILPTEDILYDRVESTSRTFGIVAALMGSLSAALLTMNTYDGYDTGRVEMKRLRTDNRGRLEDGRVTILPRREEDSRDNSSSATNIRRRDTLGFIEHVTFTHHVSGTSLLVSWGLEEDQLEDFYTACCAGSFYSGVLTTVISSVLVRNSIYLV